MDHYGGWECVETQEDDSFHSIPAAVEDPYAVSPPAEEEGEDIAAEDPYTILLPVEEVEESSVTGDPYLPEVGS